MKRARVAVLVSGGGTNLQAMIDAEARRELPHAHIALVISNKEDAYALKRAESAGIERRVIDGVDFEPRLQAELERSGIELIALAGFLRILSGEFTARWHNRIINVHPSLIPAFCGKGFYGLKVHEAALARGVKLSGATVHFVNEEPDGGRIISQRAVEVLEGDTPESLQKRIMERAEWALLPAAVEDICRKITEGSI